MNIKDYMTAPALTIPPEMTIPEARGLLKARHFRHLPVAGPDRRLLGMVTDRDLRSAYRELFGLGEPGSALLTVADDGQPHPLTRISKIIEEAGVRCDRLLRHQETIYLRVNTYRLAPLRAALAQAGFQQVGEKPL